MTQYNHKEAFCLMWYACRKCMHKERIWNSRDGVTPFSCTCPSCGQSEMLHDHWHLDTCVPSHQLLPGQKFWRDGTPDEAEAIMRRRIEKFKQAPPDRLQPLTAEREDKLIASARAGGDDSGFRKGWPTLDVHVNTSSTTNVWVAMRDGNSGCVFDDEARAKAFVERRNYYAKKHDGTMWSLQDVPFNRTEDAQ